MNSLYVTGQNGEALVAFEDGGKTHYLLPEVIASWQRFQQVAAAAHFEVVIVSGYRNFERQLAIWNAKATGQRPVIDDAGALVDILSLTALEKIHAIMRFSALPGASRHHWGSDFDIFEVSRLPLGYQCQLTLAETCGDGPCADFYRWLDDYQQQPEFEFMRPYAEDTGGVAVEPWHLSHQQTAARYQSLLSPALVKTAISEQPLALKETVLANFDDLYQRYIEVKHS